MISREDTFSAYMMLCIDQGLLVSKTQEIMKYGAGLNLHDYSPKGDTVINEFIADCNGIFDLYTADDTISRILSVYGAKAKFKHISLLEIYNGHVAVKVVFIKPNTIVFSSINKLNLYNALEEIKSLITTINDKAKNYVKVRNMAMYMQSCHMNLVYDNYVINAVDNKLVITSEDGTEEITLHGINYHNKSAESLLEKVIAAHGRFKHMYTDFNNMFDASAIRTNSFCLDSCHEHADMQIAEISKNHKARVVLSRIYNVITCSEADEKFVLEFVDSSTPKVSEVTKTVTKSLNPLEQAMHSKPEEVYAALLKHCPPEVLLLVETEIGV